MTKTVLILGGSGKIGRHATRAFTKAGWTVRQFDRKTDDMTRAAMGADVIVNGLNPPAYHNWKVLIPQITAQVIAAAKASGATVILPGNVYNFGDTPGTWDEHTAQNPVTRKGRIRVEMEQAYRASGVQTIVLRAGNFIDPDQTDDIMSMVLMRSITKGRITYPGNPDTMQAYAYLPDWAEAARMLAEKRDSLAQFEDVPLGGLAFSANQLAAHVAQATGRKIKVTGFPWVVFRLTAPFWELAREMLEMRYLWETGHQLSDAKLRALLPEFQPTPASVAMRAGLPRDIHPDNAVPAARRVTA